MNCESPNRRYQYREWAFAGPRDAIRLLKRDRRKHRNPLQACTDYISTQNTTYFSSPIRLIKSIHVFSIDKYTQCRLSLVVIASLKFTKLKLPFQQRNESLLHASVSHLLARQTFISHSYWTFTIKIGCQRVKICLSAILVYNRTQKIARSCAKCFQSDFGAQDLFSYFSDDLLICVVRLATSSANENCGNGHQKSLQLQTLSRLSRSFLIMMKKLTNYLCSL